MKQNMYELARQLKSPGVLTTASFNPNRLTKTIRNMVRKSIASGRHPWTRKRPRRHHDRYHMGSPLPKRGQAHE